MSKYLDLSGLTYFANKIKAAINAVSETASSALTAAGTAQSTADTASSKADAAQTTANAAQADATKALSKFVTLKISGTTNNYGVISMPDKSYYPIASLSRAYAINGDQNSIRVLNTGATDVMLAINTEVNFNILAMKKS